MKGAMRNSRLIRATGVALATGLLSACAPAESEQPPSPPPAPSIIIEPAPHADNLCTIPGQKLGQEYKSTGDSFEIEKMLGNWGPENSQIAWGDMRVAFAVHLVDHPIPNEPNPAYQINTEVTSGPNTSAEQATETARKLGHLAAQKLALEEVRLVQGESKGLVSPVATETMTLQPVMFEDSPHCRPLDAQDF